MVHREGRRERGKEGEREGGREEGDQVEQFESFLFFFQAQHTLKIPGWLFFFTHLPETFERLHDATQLSSRLGKHCI